MNLCLWLLTSWQRVPAHWSHLNGFHVDKQFTISLNFRNYFHRSSWFFLIFHSQSIFKPSYKRLWPMTLNFWNLESSFCCCHTSWFFPGTLNQSISNWQSNLSKIPTNSFWTCAWIFVHTKSGLLNFCFSFCLQLKLDFNVVKTDVNY